MNDTTPMKQKKLFKMCSEYKRNLNSNKLILNSESKNKASLECSYLLNEINLKNRLLLSSIKTKKNKICIKKSFISNRNKHLKKLFKISKELTTNKEEEPTHKIDMASKTSNLNKSISLSSLINLPKIKIRNGMNIRQKLIKKKNFGKYFVGKTNLENNRNQKKNKAFSLKKFMKENFYSDVQNKFNDKIKTIYFRNDSTIKHEIMTMKKIGTFWSKFIQYCSPIIRLQKIKLMKRNILSKFDQHITRANSMININKIKN